MRIFLSYGHDKYASLAVRIKKDLEARGHEVWFDLDRLRPGGDWEGYIEEGFEWVSGVPEQGRLLLLMTPHSVRRPDGYCLNELARAYGRGLPIIPVMVSAVEPPLSICRIQYLDMRDCFPVQDHEEKYRPKLEQLADAIEHNKLDFQGVQSRLLAYLQPLPYEAELAQQLARFIGRKWVMKEVADWLKLPRRVLWITGEAGVGKSAIAAWLCDRRPEVAAFHYCRHGNSDRTDGSKALFSLAYQLSTQLPVYQDRLNALLESLRGKTDVQALFDSLFVDPLYDLKFDRPFVLVVDALDEATNNGKNVLASLIRDELSRTPDWLRLIVTSRPHEPEINFALNALNPWKLEADRPENIEDIRAYLNRELQPFAGNREPPAAAVDTIIDKSEGLFLYVTKVREELAEGRLFLDRLDEFPRGLGGIYARDFQRYFPAEGEYESKWRPVLEVICAAREPLAVGELASLFGWSEYEREKNVRSLGSLFPAADSRVRPFHKSLPDWLTDSEHRAGPYYCSPAEGHRLLADFGWRQYQSGITNMARYFVIHLPAHLSACGRTNDLGKLLLDFDWINAKLAATEVAAVIADYGYLSESSSETKGNPKPPPERPIGIPPWRIVTDD